MCRASWENALTAAITGWALRTPLGNDSATFIRRLAAGERAHTEAAVSGSSSSTRILTSIAGHPQSNRHHRFLGRLELFAVDCALEAYGQRRVDDDRLGLFSATGGLRVRWDESGPCLRQQAPDAVDCWERGLRRLHPFWILRHLSNNVHALVSADVEARGEGVSFGGASSGAQAIAAASRALRSRAIDVAIVVAYDSLITPESVLDGENRRVFSRRALPELTAPYDRSVEGAVPGEAAAAVVLERAQEASHPPLALVRARALADGSHGYAGPAAVEGALGPLFSSGADEQVLVDGAGQAISERDREERKAVARCLSANTPLSCVSAATGLLGAATSVVQAIALALLLEHELAPRIAGLRQPADGPLCPLEQTRRAHFNGALGITLGAPGLVGIVKVERP